MHGYDGNGVNGGHYPPHGGHGLPHPHPGEGPEGPHGLQQQGDNQMMFNNPSPDVLQHQQQQQQHGPMHDGGLQQPVGFDHHLDGGGGGLGGEHDNMVSQPLSSAGYTLTSLDATSPIGSET